jgi:hypothetical protein
LIKFFCREAIGQTVALRGARLLGRRTAKLSGVDLIEGVADDVELVYLEAGPVRVTS